MKTIFSSDDFQQLSEALCEPIYHNLKGKHILIAGATGMLALYMTNFFIYLNEEKDMNITLYLLARNEAKVKRLYGSAVDATFVKLLIQDVCDPIYMDDTIDYIVHAAGAADPHSIRNHPIGIMKANTLGTIQLSEFAVQKQAHILFLSTREIYGEQDASITKLTENSYGGLDCLQSRSCYPESKKSAEAILKSYASEKQLKFNVARIAHSYGPGMMIENDGRIMADMIHDLVYQKDVVLKSDGLMKRAFCYVSDAVKALLYIMTLGESEVAYNVANETEEIRVVDLAHMIANMAHTNVVFQSQSAEQKKGYLQIPRVSLDTTRIEALGWKASISLQDGIIKTQKSFVKS